ncbi:MAG: alpha/beta fold hydrolase [Betaproteobacteria bacterium]|nr:alpha/beta fold hydrolase [Betaproteobacteria bacterium]
MLAVLGLLLLYPALGWLGFTTAQRAGIDVAFWCASSAWVATLVTTPRQHWRVVNVAGVMAAGLFMWLLGAPWLPAITFVFADGFAVFMTARYIVKHRYGWSGSAQPLVLVLLAACMHTLLLAPAGGWLVAAMETDGRFATVLLEWFSTSLSGALIAIPYLQMRLQPAPVAAAVPAQRDRWLGLVFWLGLIAGSVAVAGVSGQRPGWEASLGWLTYLPLLCAVALSLLWPSRGAVVATVTLVVLELLFLSYGGRLWTHPAVTVEQTIQLRWYLSAAAVLSALTAALGGELRRQLAQIEAWKARYESTLTNARLLQYEVKLPSQKISWSGNTAAHFGVPAAAISTVPLWSERIHPGDQGRFAEYLQIVAGGDESPPDLRVRAMLADGHYAPVQIKVSGITSFEGAIDSVRGSVQLAGARKRGKLKLYRAEAAAATDAAASRRPAVMMVHGIGGSEHDFGPLYKVLGSNGFDPQPLTLPGHRGHPEDLLHVRADDWIDAAAAHLQKLQLRYEVVHIMGISLGALVALEVAKRAGSLTGRLILISAPVFIDGWNVPWFYALRYPLYRFSLACKLIKVEEEDPFGVKDERIRAIVVEKFARDESYHYRYVPLGCVREIDVLRNRLLQSRQRPACRSLIIHSREDDLTSDRSAEWLQRHLGEQESEIAWLNNSYHMVCIDNDRDLVSRGVLSFLQAATAADRTEQVVEKGSQ